MLCFQLKALNYDHLVQLIGLDTTSASALMFVYEYCTKGNIMVAMGRIQLDVELKLALVGDLIEVRHVL